MLRVVWSEDENLAAVEQGLAAQGCGETVIEPRMHVVPDKSGAFRAPINLAGVKTALASQGAKTGREFARRGRRRDRRGHRALGESHQGREDWAAAVVGNRSGVCDNCGR